MVIIPHVVHMPSKWSNPSARGNNTDEELTYFLFFVLFYLYSEALYRNQNDLSRIAAEQQELEVLHRTLTEEHAQLHSKYVSNQMIVKKKKSSIEFVYLCSFIVLFTRGLPYRKHLKKKRTTYKYDYKTWTKLWPKPTKLGVRILGCEKKSNTWNKICK